MKTIRASVIFCVILVLSQPMLPKAQNVTQDMACRKNKEVAAVNGNGNNGLIKPPEKATTAICTSTPLPAGLTGIPDQDQSTSPTAKSSNTTQMTNATLLKPLQILKEKNQEAKEERELALRILNRENEAGRSACSVTSLTFQPVTVTASNGQTVPAASPKVETTTAKVEMEGAKNKTTNDFSNKGAQDVKFEIQIWPETYMASEAVTVATCKSHKNTETPSDQVHIKDTKHKQPHDISHKCAQAAKAKIKAKDIKTKHGQLVNGPTKPLSTETGGILTRNARRLRQRNCYYHRPEKKLKVRSDYNDMQSKKTQDKAANRHAWKELKDSFNSNNTSKSGLTPRPAKPHRLVRNRRRLKKNQRHRNRE